MILKLRQSGFSLVQGLVITGALAGSALVGVKLLKDQKQASRTSQTQSDVERLHSLIYTTLQNKDHCTATVKGYVGGTDVSAALVNTRSNPQIEAIRTVTRTSVTPSGLQVSEAVVTYARNNKNGIDPSRIYMNGNVIIEKLQFQYPAPQGKGFALLNINYERMSKDSQTKTGYGAKDLQKSILLRVQRAPDNTANEFDNLFEGCYAVTDQIQNTEELGNKDLIKQMCLELNGQGNPSLNKSFFVWNEDLSNCLPRNFTCNPGEVYAGITSNGEAKCPKLEDWVDLNTFIDKTSPTPCVNEAKAKLIKVSGNKVKVICSLDCRGNWGPCINGVETYSVTRPAAGEGAPCSHPNGATRSCAMPENCVGSWGACIAGYQTYHITKQAKDGGASCPHSDGATKSCGPTPPVTPPITPPVEPPKDEKKPIDCVGSWGSQCSGGFETYTIITPAQNGGKACPFKNGDKRENPKCEDKVKENGICGTKRNTCVSPAAPTNMNSSGTGSYWEPAKGQTSANWVCPGKNGGQDANCSVACQEYGGSKLAEETIGPVQQGSAFSSTCRYYYGGVLEWRTNPFEGTIMTCRKRMCK